MCTCQQCAESQGFLANLQLHNVLIVGFRSAAALQIAAWNADVLLGLQLAGRTLGFCELLYMLHAGQTALYENIGRHEALWTFNITAAAWTQQRPTGDLPDPHLACALAVANGQVYVMANDPEGTKRLEVYELNMTSWEWRRLPPTGTQPSCRRAASAVVVQVSMG